VCSCWRCSITGKLAVLWSVACRSSSRTWKAIAGQRCQGDGQTAHRQPIGRAVDWSGIGMLDHRQTGGAAVSGVPLIEPHLEGDRRPAGQVDGETAYRQPIGRAVVWSGCRGTGKPRLCGRCGPCWWYSITGKLAVLRSVECRSSSRTWKAIAG
jgi:hypothetical protein